MTQQKPQPNTILEPEQSHTHSLQQLKLDYLLDQKHRLQIEMHELTLNNQLLRKINQGISKNGHPQLDTLVKRNCQLEDMLDRMCNQNKQLRADIFLNSQVNFENQKEHKEVTHNYQNKIKELRFLIQIKQTNIQSLETLISEKKWIVPTSNNFQTFQSYEEMKEKLNNTLKQSNTLFNQNCKLKNENEKISQKLQKMSKLLGSKCTFLQYRNLLEEKGARSSPKLKANIQLLNLHQYQIRAKKRGLESTCQTKDAFKKNVDSTIYGGNNSQYQYENHMKLVKLNEIINSRNEQIQNLIQAIKSLKRKIQIMGIQKKKIIDSNNSYQKSYLALTKKTNQYETMVKVLFDCLAQRSGLQKYINFGYHDDLQKETCGIKKKVQAIGNSSKIMRIQKESWINMKKVLTERLSNFKAEGKKKRSFSCVLDYVPHQQLQVYDIVHKKSNEIQEQFSMFLEQSKFSHQDIKVVFGNNKNNRQIQKSKKTRQHEYGLFEDIDLQMSLSRN